jgi:hypothetical protein
MSGSALDLSRIAHVALDMDGTIYRAKRLFDATRPFLDRLGRLGIGHSSGHPRTDGGTRRPGRPGD